MLFTSQEQHDMRILWGLVFGALGFWLSDITSCITVVLCVLAPLPGLDQTLTKSTEVCLERLHFQA